MQLCVCVCVYATVTKMQAFAPSSRLVHYLHLDYSQERELLPSLVCYYKCTLSTRTRNIASGRKLHVFTGFRKWNAFAIHFTGGRETYYIVRCTALARPGSCRRTPKSSWLFRFDETCTWRQNWYAVEGNKRKTILLSIIFPPGRFSSEGDGE